MITAPVDIERFVGPAVHAKISFANRVLARSASSSISVEEVD